MRKLGLSTVCIALAACNSGAGEPAESELAVAPVEQVMAADGAPPEGQYRAVSEDTGFVLLEELREDGTYAFTGTDGALIEEGSYEQKTPQELCFTPDADDAVEKCYAEEIGADGVWRTTDPDTGEVSVVERLGGERP